jgi:hypothetical protein
MRWLIRKLRDLDAWLQSYGQCQSCRRSWKRAAPVSVWHSPTEATFLLCIDCWSDIVGEQDPHAGLILQGYAENHLIRHPRSDEVVTDILAAYGMAWRVGVEWRPQWRRPLMFDVRPMLRRRGDEVAIQALTRPEVASQIGRPFTVALNPPGWDGAGSDTPNGDMEVGRG